MLITILPNMQKKMYQKAYPGLFGPDGLKFPETSKFAVSGFISSGL